MKKNSDIVYAAAITFVIIMILALLVQSCAPTPSLLSASLLPRVTISTSSIEYTCTQPVQGITLNASNVHLHDCVIQNAAGTGLQVSGNNNLIENLTIDGVTIGNGDADGCRFFGHGNYFKNITIKNVQNTSPAHADGCQTWGDSNHVAAYDTTFDGMIIDIFSVYIDSSGVNHKTACFQIESGSPSSNIAHNITIKNSVLHCYRTVSLGDPDDQGTTNNIFISNNTIVGQLPRPNAAIEEFGIFVSKATAVTVQYNIFYNLDGEHLLGAITAGYNFVYRSDSGRIYAPTYSTDKLAVSPLFIDPINGNYGLFSNSPACNFGNSYAGAFPCAIQNGTPIPSKTPTASQIPTLATATLGVTPTISAIPPTKTPTSPPVTLPPTGMIIPLYSYPTHSGESCGIWDNVIAAKVANPSVTIMAIVNPKNGPGISVNADYTFCINKLVGGGIVVAGYTDSNYGFSPVDPKVDTDTWKRLYPQVTWIFVDEMSTSVDQIESLKAIDTHAKEQGFAGAIGNPGSDAPDASITGTFDIVMIYEGSGLPSTTAEARINSHPVELRDKISIIPWNVPSLDLDFVQRMKAHVGWIYMTNDNDTNVWNSLPPYLNSLASSLASNVIPPTPVKTATGSPSVTPSRTSTILPTLTRTAIPVASRTATVVPPSKTPTPVPSGGLCARIVWDAIFTSQDLAIRPSASLSNTSDGWYKFDRVIPIEGVVTIGSDTWAQVNRGQFFALKIGTTVYSKIVACP